MAPESLPVLADNVVPLNARQTTKAAPAGVLGTLSAEARRVLGPALEEAFRATDDDLFRRSEQNQELFDGLRELRLRQPLIARHFLERVEQSLVLPSPPGAASGTSAPALSLGELSLVDEGELEETLAVSRMVAAADQAYAGDLLAFRHRFAVLAGGQDPEALDLPLRPQAIADAFEQSLKEWSGLSLSLKIVLYKHFERHAMGALGALLATVNEKLVAAGILPSFRPQVANKPSASYARPTTAPTAEQAGSSSLPPGAWGSDTDWGQLHALLASRRQEEGPAGVLAGPSRPAASIQELGEALLAFRELQGVLGSFSEGSPLPPGQFKARLLEQLQAKTQGQKGLGVHEDTIDAVGMLFEHILKDPNLPASMQVLLSRLQLPFIKVAVLEPDLFSRADHPARKLLDLLGETAKGWSAEADKDKALLRKLEEVVETINHGFVEDNKVFEHQLSGFQSFLEDLGRSQSAAEKRSEEIAQNKDRMENAQAVVTQAMVERTAGKPLPEWARSLLLRDWTSHMILVMRKEGQDSPAFRKALFFIEKVVGANQCDSEASQKALATLIPSLLHQVREGLLAVGVEEAALSGVEKNLKAYLETCAGLREAQPLPPLVPVLPAKIEPAVSKPKPEQRWLDKASSLSVGDWVEFREENGKSTRGKVAWVSGFSGKILFVTISGTRLGERLSEDLAWLLQRGQARVIESKPLFERAVGSILEKLKG